jgi:hypothetical protein
MAKSEQSLVGLTEKGLTMSKRLTLAAAGPVLHDGASGIKAVPTTVKME